ncbi:RNA polymerase sigma factor [uncultured Croceitalea sp.]|uniref:RNA polymerase sigma factor n=1 Tax=uncultured Croceitalea sp. TaxID=1798908 RepID=UPI00374EF9EF
MKKDYSEDQNILLELKKSNSDSLKYLIDNYHHRLCVYAYSLSSDYDGAKDIVQNVFVNIWERRKDLPNIKNFKSYLYRAVYNEFIKQLRYSGRVLVFEKEYFETLDLIRDEEIDNLTNKKIKIIKEEIQKLPPRCKEIFLMSKQEGLTYIEISDHLNISIKTVEAQMLLAFKKLRESVGAKIEQFLFLLFRHLPKVETVD